MICRVAARELTTRLGTLLLLVGCTAEPPPPAVNLINVQGTVMQNGEPVPRTIVVFTPVAEGGTRAKGFTDQRGRYRLIHESDAPGAEPGEYRVVFQTLHARASPAGGESDAAYSDPNTTPFHATVSPDAATFHFKLSRPGTE